MRKINGVLLMFSLICLMIFIACADGNLRVAVPGMLISGLVFVITLRIENRLSQLEGHEDVE